MAKVCFKYATMSGGKTALACIHAYNYEERGLRPLCFSPKVDTRAGVFFRDNYDYEKSKWSSRINSLEREVFVVEEDQSIIQLASELALFYGDYDVIMVDEVQFLNPTQIEELFKIAINYNKPVICHGLMTTYKTTMFEGSKRLVELGAKLEHIKSVGTDGENTVVNAKFDGDVLVTEGEDVEIGGDEKYCALTLKEYWAILEHQNNYYTTDTVQ